jgi:hypothetical protein
MYANNRICVLDTDTVAEVKQKIARQLPQLLVEGTACALTDPNEIDGALADECPLVFTSLRDGSVVVWGEPPPPPSMESLLNAIEGEQERKIVADAISKIKGGATRLIESAAAGLYE